MEFTIKPVNYNVYSAEGLERCLVFYEKEFGLKEVDRKECPDYTIVRLGVDDRLPSLLELTCYHREPIINTEFDRCLALAVEDYEASLARHEAMGRVVDKIEDKCYYIEDPEENVIAIYPKVFDEVGSKSEFGLSTDYYNVSDLEGSLAFYEEALGLKEVDRKECPDYTVVGLGADGRLPHQLELIFYHKDSFFDTLITSYNVVFEVEDYEAALAYHRAMGCVYEKDVESDNYCIRDLDHRGIWIYPKFSAVRDDLVSFVDEEEA